ncbi:MAG TPA: hypothetical protein VFI91_10660 [Longimicrobiaceae bacterium]|nr:hypothetical protein [Longimicrobiaceae bacterium]
MDGQALQLMPDPESGTAHSGSGIARIDANHIAITLHEGSLADPKVGLEARVLRLSDGREVRAMPAPSILRFIQAGRVYGYENLPYPRILIYSRDILKN